MAGTRTEDFMMDEPTRGIDVGAKYEIYELIINMAKQGKTIHRCFIGNAGDSRYNKPYWCHVEWAVVWYREYQRDKPGRTFKTQCEISITGR